MSDLRIGNQQQGVMVRNEETKQESTSEFRKVINGTIERVNRLDQEADRSIMDLLKGKADIHESMIALQKMDISMRLLLTIRNKAVEAYKEIMHMQF
ncbi:MAG: flagellar hook-basal body complex protein FliE [Pseudomonadota bacterium]|uniref:Flagellar hook-basal body complex protein FliE n=1 Tax=Candidatus Desulfatibia profunda TaxID=2841695 RepID=A0A8J6NQX7_9BACT|nr:flagellar hook-basal body complex protein FliE [Candidatus Desulfatibia profunda]MBL7195973.1 flagellar hook-basal body complex protein FliE [Desulfobacterales bacterium]MBU0698832.1 flagellar hook-basal body complex protein FliE [Pseudomonadota bacterium]